MSWRAPAFLSHTALTLAENTTKTMGRSHCVKVASSFGARVPANDAELRRHHPIRELTSAPLEALRGNFFDVTIEAWYARLTSDFRGRVRFPTGGDSLRAQNVDEVSPRVTVSSLSPSGPAISPRPVSFLRAVDLVQSQSRRYSPDERRSRSAECLCLVLRCIPGEA